MAWLALALTAFATACGAPQQSTTAASPIELMVRTTAAPAPVAVEAAALPTRVIIYAPVVVQGMPMEPTPQATLRPGAPTPALPARGGLETTLISAEKATGTGLELDVEGEVTNVGTAPIQGVRVLVDGRGHAGSCGRGALTLMGKAEAVLQPGESWPFAGQVALTCATVGVLADTMALETQMPALRLTVLNPEVGMSAEGDWQLRGVLRNDTGTPVAYPRVIITLRAVDDSYLAANQAFTAVSSLAGGAEAPFTVTIPAGRTTGWASYSVLATGERR